MKKIDDWIVNSISLYYLKKFELEGIKKTYEGVLWR